MKNRWIIATLLSLLLITTAGSLLTIRSGVAATVASTSAITPEPTLAGATVTITNFQFSPKVVRIKAGAEVTWTVKEGTHNVTGDGGAWASPTLSAGKSFSHQFATAGTYGYHCSFHGNVGHDMFGTVIVSR